MKIISNNFGGFIPPETFFYSDLCHDIYFVLTSVENAYTHVSHSLISFRYFASMKLENFAHNFSDILVTECSINFHLIFDNLFLYLISI